MKKVIPILKRCCKCKVGLPRECFPVNRNTLDGLCRRCRKCGAEANKIWLKNLSPEKRKAKNERRRLRRQAKAALLPRAADGNKICRHCNVEKSESSFYRSYNNSNGFSARCKSCTLSLNRVGRWRRSYGITKEKYSELLKLQNNGCAICSGPMNPICIDHCHLTNKYRGLLCKKCNTGIGQLNDSPSLLRKALEYLENAKNKNK